MNKTNRILLNTIVLYTKIIVCTLLSLFLVPILLKALGKEDFGLYNLVAGVIMMLSFLNASMTVSTQRYLSITLGTSNVKRLCQVFQSSILLHFVIGALVVIILELLAFFLFDGVLNIPEDKIATAKCIYQLFIASTFFTIMSVPADSVLNAYENMSVYSVVSIVESLLRLCIAFMITYIDNYRLEAYCLGFMLVSLSSATAKYLYCFINYRQIFSIYEIDKKLFSEMGGFASWNLFGSAAVVARNQGTAIVLNTFFGLIVNAAYGVTNQVNSLLGYFSSTIQKSINPQLMQSEGRHDRKAMLNYAFKMSRFTVLTMEFVALPVFMEMPLILKYWLRDEIPDHTLDFARLILIVAIIYQMSSGIMSAIQSTGKIKWYQITMGLLILMNIPVSYMFLSLGYSANIVFVIMISIEVISLLSRLWFARVLTGMSVSNYLNKVIIPLVLCPLTASVLLYPLVRYIAPCFPRIILVSVSSTVLLVLLAWRFILEEDERNWVMSKLQRLRVRNTTDRR